MPLILHLIAHAATAELRAGTFPADEALDARGLADATRAAAHWRWPPNAVVLASPALRARQTAEALGLHATAIEPALADLDAGRWRGQRIVAIAQDAPEQLETWINDPAAAPHGGESFVDVLQRVGAWLDALPPDGAGTVAVTHAAVLRAALAHALGTAPEAMLRIDIAPLTRIVLTRSPRGWTLRLDDALAPPTSQPG
ncbi:histidine phosphatase family protein [Burkholderia plantarii]|uniref:histidine phosphatase family protein n=1 Tax=Burkholderia plantarii TaxID=41899 RepID=UPI00272CC7BE|nr:histidine phosphatase family protein [Burkholderia plantarii]WLE61165.1 histidine phosphatase family protein [Burkholderia plantarii]